MQNLLELTKSNDFDVRTNASNEWQKKNRFKLTSCFSGDLVDLTAYQKYIGKDYLKVEFKDYTYCYMHTKKQQNVIKFSWGTYTKTIIFKFGTIWNFKEECDYLQQSLDWYNAIKSDSCYVAATTLDCK